MHFKKRETKTISFLIQPEKLAFFGMNMKRIIEPGEFEIQVGKNSAEYVSKKFQVVTKYHKK